MSASTVIRQGDAIWVRRQWLALAVPLLWGAASLPVAALRWPVFLAFAVVIIASPVAAALVLVTSGFFFATMNLDSSQIYWLRALCIVSFLAWWVLVLRGPLPRQLVLWIAGVAALLCAGTLVSTAALGLPATGGRPAHFEALVAMTWVGGTVAGFGLVRARGGQLADRDILVIAAVWLIAIGYGVAQAVAGINETTVPREVLFQVEGFRQYEDLGRRPFASLTANGMAATSLLPLTLLLLRWRGSMVAGLIVTSLGLLVGALTLTRSYLALVVLLALLLPFLPGAARRTSVVPLVLVVAGAIALGVAADPELLSLALRFEGGVAGLRGEIWTYTLQQMQPWDWLTGMGFGSEVWREFLAPLSTDKDLASPHTALLEVAGQLGVVGAAFYLAIGARMLKSAWQLRAAPLAAAPALVGLLVLGREQVAASYVFSPSMLAVPFWFTFGMVLAAAAGHGAGQSTQASPEPA